MSAILGTAIGMVFVFALSALFCSAITETVSNLLQLRAKYLIAGVRSMLDGTPKDASSSGTGPIDNVKIAATRFADWVNESAKPQSAEAEQPLVPAATAVAPASAAPAGGGAGTAPAPVGGSGGTVGDTTANVLQTADLVDSVLQHPLINSLKTKKIGLAVLRDPQYISSRLFAQVLIDTLVPTTLDGQPAQHDLLAKVRATVARLGEKFPAKRSILALIDNAGLDLAQFQANLEKWYDDEMDRISGLYKRWSRIVLFGIGLLFAVLANIDTVQVTRVLYHEEPIRSAVVAQATSGICANTADPTAERTCAQAELSTLADEGLPVFSGCPLNVDKCLDKGVGPLSGSGWMIKIAGWLITAVAVSFGAPFWFDALSKLGNLRGAGTKPNPAGP